MEKLEKQEKTSNVLKLKETIGQTMIYKDKLQRKLKTEKQKTKNLGVNSGASEGLNSYNICLVY
jgi:hypothetical protein